MNDIAQTVGSFFMNLLVSTGIIAVSTDEFATPIGYCILAILIAIFLFSMRKILSR